jgi:hypothetical protein
MASVDDYTTKLKRYLPSSQDLFWAILLGFGLGLFFLLRKGLPLWQSLPLLLALSYLWHWGHLYKKAMLKKQMALLKSPTIPRECFTQKSWTDYFWASNHNCAEYHEALMVDPLWEVTPTMAVAETLTLLVVQPLEHLGTHLGKFFSSLLASQSWLASIPVLAFVCLVTLVLLVMLFGYKIKLPWFLGSIEPQAYHRPSTQVLGLESKIQELETKIRSLERSEPALPEVSEQKAAIASAVVPESVPADEKYKLLEQKMAQIQEAMGQLRIANSASSSPEKVARSSSPKLTAAAEDPLDEDSNQGWSAASRETKEVSGNDAAATSDSSDAISGVISVTSGSCDAISGIEAAVTSGNCDPFPGISAITSCSCDAISGIEAAATSGNCDAISGASDIEPLRPGINEGASCLDDVTSGQVVTSGSGSECGQTDSEGSKEDPFEWVVSLTP